MLNQESLTVLQNCPLFAALAPGEWSMILPYLKGSLKLYSRDQIIAFEEDPCQAIGVVIEGSIHIQRIFPSGKSITIETLRPGDSFGEALLFANQGVYPATLIAPEDCQVLFIPKEEVLLLLEKSAAFRANMLRSLSNRILLLNRRIKGLTLGTVRQKVANYLLEEWARQKRTQLVMTWARHELADALGIPRPSLSRELIAMREEGWIHFDRKTITILNLAALRSSLGN
mgnify:CR=1 FL=1